MKNDSLRSLILLNHILRDRFSLTCRNQSNANPPKHGELLPCA
ncbi:MAG: hypothetical protein AB1589_17735 [Cyanobacteriota bacterium]